MNWHRMILLAAAVYNCAFGVWAGFFPASFFRLFDLAAPRYPSIWACLGMVVGLYGVAYAHVAWRPERGGVIVWIGLAGKVLGPIGWLIAVGHGELPPRTFPIILANDLIWWFPFLFYLLRDVPQRRPIIAWACVTLHLGACTGLLVVRGGTEVEPDIAARAAWVLEWAPVWTATWVAWALSSLSLLAFLITWSQRLVERGAARAAVAGCCLVCAVGLAFDLSGEAVNIVRLTRPGQSVAEFARGARLYAVLGAGVANGLYCVAGPLLSAMAWRVGQLRGALGVAGFVMWAVGMSLTIVTIFDYQFGMNAAGGATRALFIPWAACVAWRLGAERTEINRHLAVGALEEV